MPSTIRESASRTKNFVKNHKICLTLGVVATATIATQQAKIQEFNEFLEEKGYKDEFQSKYTILNEEN